jgi:hypothetical protein
MTTPHGTLLTFHPEQSRRPQWQTSLGWEELPNYSESRRHSMAEIPTRRGSIVAGGSRVDTYNTNNPSCKFSWAHLGHMNLTCKQTSFVASLHSLRH